MRECRAGSPEDSQKHHSSGAEKHSNLEDAPRQGKAARPHTGFGKVEESGKLSACGQEQ